MDLQYIKMASVRHWDIADQCSLQLSKQKDDFKGKLIEAVHSLTHGMLLALGLIR